MKECGAVIKDIFTFHISFTPLLYLSNTRLCRDGHQPLLRGKKRENTHLTILHMYGCMQTWEPVWHLWDFGTALTVILDFL